MTYPRINMILLVLIVLTILADFALRADYSQPNYDFLPDMQYSPAYKAYSKNPVFANGRTLQDPVAGTLARGSMPLHYEATPQDALRAGEELQSPIKPDDELALERGAEVYRVSCVICHGGTGAGDGPVASRGVPSLPISIGNSVRWKDGHLFHILTYGKGGMASYAGQLTPYDRWCVITHVRTLQAAAAEKAAEKTAESAAPADAPAEEQVGAESDAKETAVEETPPDAVQEEPDHDAAQGRQESNE